MESSAQAARPPDAAHITVRGLSKQFQGAAVYERRSSGYIRIGDNGLTGLPAVVDVDDPAFVRLRARLSQVDLNDVASSLGADAIAFALVVRGQVTGALICGRRRNGESYAPDEIRMLRGAAHEIAAELHAIRARERSELLAALTSGQMDVETARTRLAALS
jgi:GAF domain-containing protein